MNGLKKRPQFPKILVFHTQTCSGGRNAPATQLSELPRTADGHALQSALWAGEGTLKGYLRDEGPHQPPRQHHCDERRQVVVNEVEILKEEREKVFTRGTDSKTTQLGWDWKAGC